LFDIDISLTNEINILDEFLNLKEIIHSQKQPFSTINIINRKNKSIDCFLSFIKQDNYILTTNNSHNNIITRSFKNKHNTKYVFEDIIGNSHQINKVIIEAKELASVSSSIMITGESGCGKELLAQSIHNASKRVNKPFVAVNCGAIPKDLIESELFGYEGGSFTGAKSSGTQGKFQQANGGTIFLDEIGEMPLGMQVTLLRVLQEKIITKIGAKESTPIDVRVISATNKNLKDEIKKGLFREDLYYRLTVFPIELPPLRDRIGDIPILLDHFLEIKSQSLHKLKPKISQDLFNKIISYCWPGNIRELENFVENLVVLNGLSSFKIDLTECHCLTHDNLGNVIPQSALPSNTIEDFSNTITPLITLEQNEIKKALVLCNGNMTKTASKLGISRNALYNKVKRYSISIN
ncbi:MAG: sigma-54 interaction domain-containing protein, partial [Clostridium sp.]